MPRSKTSDYKKAERIGRRAETLTKWLYHLAGYSCIAMRQKTPFGELDLILQRGQKIRVLEVKYRKKSAAEGVPVLSNAQARRIKNALVWISARHPVFKDRHVEVYLVQWSGWFYLRQTAILFEAS